MDLLPESADLWRLLRGGRVEKPPFWEVWFGMHELFKRRYGDFNQVEDRITMSKDLGMAIALLGGVNTNLGFGKHEPTTDGLIRYHGGNLTSLEQMEERKLPDWEEMISRWKHDQGLIRDSGLISWAILPWCFHSVATSMGWRELSIRVHKDFDFVDRAFEMVEERNRLAIDQVIREVRPDVVLFDGDCSYKHGLMVPPGIFRRLVRDRTDQTLRHLRPLGIPYVFHTDGKLDDVIPVMVELGFSMIHGCEKTANDLGDLVDRFGDQIVLAGNMDIGFLTWASRREIRRETLSMLETGSRKGRYVAACNTSPMDSIPDENYLSMVEAIRSYRAYGQTSDDM